MEIYAKSHLPEEGYIRPAEGLPSPLLFQIGRRRVVARPPLNLNMQDGDDDTAMRRGQVYSNGHITWALPIQTPGSSLDHRRFIIKHECIPPRRCSWHRHQRRLWEKKARSRCFAYRRPRGVSLSVEILSPSVASENHRLLFALRIDERRYGAFAYCHACLSRRTVDSPLPTYNGSSIRSI